MHKPIPMTFERQEQAQAARMDLMQAGFGPEHLNLSALHDEAGPVEGNFLAGNVKRDTVKGTLFHKSLGGEGDNSYLHNFKNTVERGVWMLTVQAQSQEQQDQACAIMRRHGAVDPLGMHDPRTGPNG